MGVVIKQSLWSTVITYTGVMIGYVYSLYLRPEFLTLVEIGVISLITANAMIISPFCMGGMSGTWIREFPNFKDDEKFKNQYFTFLLLWVLSLNLVVITIGWLLKDHIIDYLSEGSPAYAKYVGVTVIVIVANCLFEVFFAYSKTILKIIFPSFLRDILIRIGMIVLIIGFAFGWWNFEWTAKGIAFIYVLTLIIIMFYVISVHGLRISFSLNLIKWSYMLSSLKVGGYFMLLSSSYALVNNASYQQIAGYLGESMSGIFTICFFMGVLVEMPRRNMIKVISPIISDLMKEGRIKDVKNYYIKGSVTMVCFGALLLIGIITNVNDLFEFIPQGDKISSGFWIVISVCSSKLIMMLFSLNGEIISFSDNFRFSVYTQIISSIILLSLNVLLIPRIGLNGAGISYFCAIVSLSIMRCVLVYKWFHIHPFTKSHLTLFIISIIIFLIFFFAPLPFHPIINIGIRSLLTTILYVFMVFKTNISPDINQSLRTIFGKISR